MEIVSKTIKEVIQYASLDKERFAEEIQSHIEDRQTVDFTEQRKRMTVCEKRIGELEILIAKIYEDNALGKLSDKRYTMLYNQYEGEQGQLQDEVSKSYSFPKSHVSYRKPRMVSIEQRERARQMIIVNNKVRELKQSLVELCVRLC